MAANARGETCGQINPAVFYLPIPIEWMRKARMSLEKLQDSNCFFYRARHRPVGRIRCDTEESRFSEWAKANVSITGRDEPILCLLVMLVAVVHQRDQDIRIKSIVAGQTPHHRSPLPSPR